MKRLVWSTGVLTTGRQCPRQRTARTAPRSQPFEAAEARGILERLSPRESAFATALPAPLRVTYEGVLDVGADRSLAPLKNAYRQQFKHMYFLEQVHGTGTNNGPLYVTGHSLGRALATMMLADAQTATCGKTEKCRKAPLLNIAALYTSARRR
jgi:hypothetical protein